MVLYKYEWLWLQGCSVWSVWGSEHSSWMTECLMSMSEFLYRFLCRAQRAARRRSASAPCPHVSSAWPACYGWCLLARASAPHPSEEAESDQSQHREVRWLKPQRLSEGVLCWNQFRENSFSLQVITLLLSLFLSFWRLLYSQCGMDANELTY